MRCLLVAAAIAVALPCAADQNIIANGGFENWVDLDAATLVRPEVAAVDLIPPGRAPEFFSPQCELYKGMGRTSTIAVDETVKHSGKRSVRIHNADMRDIAYEAYLTLQFIAHPEDPRNIRPNRHYLLRWWVKGEDVATNGGAGPIMMMYYDSGDGQRSWRTYSYEQETPLPLGTFDWQQRRFSFITGPHAVWAGFTFQLRWATGTVWYDDIELLDLGPVVPVETY